MSIARDIIYISIFFWLLPPFRQFRGKFFYFFLILGLSDPTSFLFVKLTSQSPEIIQIFLGILLFYSINFDLSTTRKKMYYHIAFISTLVIIYIIFNNALVILLLVHLSILLKLVRILLIKIFSEDSFNLFYFAIVFYQISVVLNLFVYLADSDIWLIIYYITLAFQILLAIFFTVFTEESKILILKLKPAD